MLLEIFSDTVCPRCYIGKRRPERALRCGRAQEPEALHDMLDLARAEDTQKGVA